MKMFAWRHAFFSLAICLGATAQGHAKADSDSTDPRDAVFATVNGEVILQSTYDVALRVGGRQRFYHGTAPEVELVAFRKEIAERLVVERVMHQEAMRRGLRPDQQWVDAEFARIERRYAASPEWHESGESLKKQIRSGLEERSLIEQVDDTYKKVDRPGEDEVRAYYAANPEKFTSPEQVRITTILLKVEPWQPKEVWDGRTAEAQRILADLRGVADFDAYAAEHPPQDRQQTQYLHRGMLSDTAQAALDGLQEGQISEVVTLLEGVAIYRLDERVPARLNPFEKVRDRAADLLAREKAESVYRERMRALRESAQVEFTNPNYHLNSAVATMRDDAHNPPPANQKK